MNFGCIVDFAKAGASIAAQEIDSRVGSDTGEPVRGLALVLELFLVLEGFDEGLLRQVLGIRDVADDAIDLHKDPAQVVGNKPVLPIRQL